MMGMDGGYVMYRASDIEPLMPILWTELIRVHKASPKRWCYADEDWICGIRPEDATIDHLLRFCCCREHDVTDTTASKCCRASRWASLLSDPEVFVSPVLRMSYGDNTPDDYGLYLVSAAIYAIRDFPPPVVSEETWT